MGRHIGLALLLGLMAVSAFGQEPEERRKYQDRTAPEWARDLLNGDVGQRQKAIYAIYQIAMWETGLGPVVVRALRDEDEYVCKTAAATFLRLGRSGPGAVPHLFDLLRSDDPALRKEAMLALFQLRFYVGTEVGPILRVLGDPDPVIRANAAGVLEMAGARVKDLATGPLLKLLDDEDPAVGNWGARALVTVNAPALVQRLHPRIRKGSPEERARAIGQLGYARQAAAAATPDLIASLSDESPKVREAAAKALGVVAAIDEESIDALAGLLSDPSAAVRRSVVEALGYSAGRAKAHAAAVAALHRDEDIEVRRAVMIALMSLGPDAAPEVVLAALDDPDPTIRSAAQGCVQSLGAKSGAVVPKLRELLRAEDPSIRSTAAQGLGGIGGAATAAEPDLITALEDEVAEVRMAAARALGTTGRGSAEAVNALIGALRDPNVGVQYAAVQTLGLFGEEAVAARGALVGFIGGDETLAVMGIRALGQMGDAARPAIPALRKALSDSRPYVRLAAAGAIFRIGPDQANDVKAIFARCLARADLRNSALGNLRELPGLAPQLIPEVLDAMRADLAFFAVFGMPTVVQYGTKEQIGEAVPILVRAIQLEGAQVGLVQNAVVTLGGLGATARPAIPALETLAAEGPEAVRPFAADAVKRIREAIEEK